jgi:hypothetical protein
MLPDHDHFSGSVHLDDAEPVMREIVSPIPVGLRRIPDRETGDQADWIFFQLRKFPQLSWLVPARPQPRPQPRSLAGLTADPGSELNFALVPYHPAGQARGTT